MVKSAAQLMHVLGNERRLQVLAWLTDPRGNFPPQRDGDLVDDGVCLVFIADKMGVSQPSASRHMDLLAGADLVMSSPIGRWTFYRRNELGIAAALSTINGTIASPSNKRKS